MAQTQTTSEHDRLEILRRTNVLEMPTFASAERYIAIAANIMHAPMSAITIVDHDHQWFKASMGLSGIKRTSRAVSFCARAIERPNSVLYVPDARKDPRFTRNPLVTGAPGIRFYIGAALLTAAGVPLGALCVIDVVPRTVSSDQILKLRGLAKMVEKSLLLGAATTQMKCRAQASA